MDVRDIEIKLRMGEDIEAIPGMAVMSPEGYANYIREVLFFVDHHGVLRSTIGEWPVAVTKDQVEALIHYLKTEVLSKHS